MIKKTVIWVCGLVFVSALSFPAFADQSIGYKQYFTKGVQAFKDHDDQKALRCFKIAQIYDPANPDLIKYLNILDNMGVVLEQHPSNVPAEESIGYNYYLNGGIKAFEQHDNQKAIRYFSIAIIYYPDSKEADRYLQILSQPNPYSSPIQVPPAQIQTVTHVTTQSVPQVLPENHPVTTAPEVQSYLPPAQTEPVSVAAQAPSYPSSVGMPPVALVPKPEIYVATQTLKGPPVVLSLAQLTNNGQIKPKVQIDFHSSLIIEGRNIQRFLVVDEGFIGVRTIDADHLEIDAFRIGTTFLHIWDALGRHTLYVEVVFPKTVTSSMLQEINNIHHSQPFLVTYTNDWSTYYQGKNVSDLKRQSYDFNQSIAVTGETPYGFFDTSGSYTDFNAFSQFDTYTIGLTQIPLEGTSNFNIRGFDALRYVSPLTMPGTRLRGSFADVDLMDNILGLSVSHGQEQVPLGFATNNISQFNQSYIDAVKLTLFPTSQTDRYSFNFATGYGLDRPTYLANHVYSIEGQHKFNDFLTLNAEQAYDSSHDSSLASLRWQQGNFRTGVNFRNIDKDYSTISTLPANQGEIGAEWTTEGDFKNFTENTLLETYRDRLDFNPDDQSALNYDANGHLRADINENWWTDSDFNFVDTPGELSPQRTIGLNQRISRSFGIWNSLKGTFFGGAGYQNSHASESNLSDYDREDVIAGIELPLINHVSTFTNYEYGWLNQPHAGGNSNPSVINAGLEYSKQFNPKFSITSQLEYRDELGVKENSNSFLSGQESIIISSGFAYNPTPDLSIFGDGDASRVLSHIGDPAYDDFEVHVGMRITFGGATYWDPMGTVSGIVFKDRNGDGKFAPGDEGVPGVKVKVGDKIALTDKDGRYRVQIRAKGVLVFPVLDTVPGGLLFSTPQSLNVEIIQGRKTQANFGLISQTGIYGIVFVDKSGTGIPNDQDKFIGKVQVVLDGKIIQKSDSHGAFYFRKVAPGRHIISVDINTLALNMVPLVKLKNSIDVTEGTNYMFNIPVQIKQAASEQK
jgi:hypothetical protein